MVGFVNAGALAVLGTRPGFSVRAFAHLFDFALTLSVGVLFACFVFGVQSAFRRTRYPKLGFFLVHAAATWLLAETILARNFARQAHAVWDGDYHVWLRIGLSAGATLGVPLGFAIATWVGTRKYLRLVLGLAALGTAIVNVCLYRDDYPETHALVAWIAALVFGPCISPLFQRKLANRWPVLLGLAAPFLFAVIHPPNSARLEIFRSPSAMGAWAYASTVWSLPRDENVVPGSLGAGFLPVSERVATPPSDLDARVPAPIVVLLTIDALRADVVIDPNNATRFPNFSSMKQEGAEFVLARSAASQTAVSLATLFSGRYFSELYWSKTGQGASRFDYPSQDETPRFPALLAAHGVQTYKACGLKFVANSFGVASGFAEEAIVVDNRRHAQADEVMGPLLQKLQKFSQAGTKPAFLYTHLMEPHAPYDRASKTGEPFERYLAEVELIDRQIGRVLRAMQSPGLRDRAYLIITSDHGEAFGEHGTDGHTKTIYEELVRVPLMIIGPGVRRQTIAEPVAHVDLGPTILDLFGLETPATFRGESLAPILFGSPSRLARPIFAEGRLRRAYYRGDIKVITDERRKTVEAFDLQKDPKELTNLAAHNDPRVKQALMELGHFFEQNSCNRTGYRPIYKP